MNSLSKLMPPDSMLNMPARIRGDLIHAAIAIQNGQIFASSAGLLGFFRDEKYRGDLNKLPSKERNLLACTEVTSGLRNKTDYLAVRPLQYPELFGQNFVVPDLAVQAVNTCCAGVAGAYASIPFALGNATFCTVHDVGSDGTLKTPTVAMGGFRFTKSAIVSSAFWAHFLEVNTLSLIARGAAIAASEHPDLVDVDSFSREVCVWGGRAGVYKSVKEAGQMPRLRDWLVKAAKADEGSAADIIREGDAIHGLGISFASKHLRFLKPAQYATFDALLAQLWRPGIPKIDEDDYFDFLSDLHVIREELAIQDDIAAIEMGLFFLIQPLIDALSLGGVTKTSARSATQFATVSESALERDFEHLGAFSGDVGVYRRKDTEHLYGFCNKFMQHQTASAPDQRREIAWTLIAELATSKRNDVLRPMMFGVNHSGLRSGYAYEYLQWWTREHLNINLSPWSVDGAEHPLLK